MKFIKAGYRLIWWIVNSFLFKKLGRRTYFKSGVLVTKSIISCGAFVRVGKNARIEGVTKYNTTQFNPSIIISDRVSIQQNVHITCAKKIFIGENTAIAANVSITDIHHPYIDVNIPIEKQNIEVKEVFIDADSKLYNNVVVLPGVRIGKHVTIGANSVVANDVPDFSVAVGSPAKVIKYYDFETKKWIVVK